MKENTEAVNQDEIKTNVDQAAANDPWKQRLLDEYTELSERIDKLDKAFDDPDFKLCAKEWRMLYDQRDAMRRYQFILEQRCVYYKLVPTPDLVPGCGTASDRH
ncbi:MAG: hypothetical protein IKD95_02195 [Bacteroidales bacterium]|nr:hypothetical protein [Bacteroidales bacterium]